MGKQRIRAIPCATGTVSPTETIGRHFIESDAKAERKCPKEK